MIRTLVLLDLLMVGSIAVAAENIPTNAKVCIAYFYADDSTYSCDGNAWEKLDPISGIQENKGSGPFAQRKSAQTLKFLKLGYEVKSCSAELNLCMFTK